MFTVSCFWCIYTTSFTLASFCFGNLKQSRLWRLRTTLNIDYCVEWFCAFILAAFPDALTWSDPKYQLQILSFLFLTASSFLIHAFLAQQVWSLQHQSSDKRGLSVAYCHPYEISQEADEYVSLVAPSKFAHPPDMWNCKRCQIHPKFHHLCR